MATLAEIVGYLSIDAGMCLVMASAFGLIVYTYDKLFEKATNAALLRMAGRLNQDAYWFGEDKATAWLLHKIAADLTTHGWSDISSLRDEWRRQRRSGDGAEECR